MRNRQKVASAIGNARVFLDMQAEFGSFDAWLWGHVGGEPVQNEWNGTKQLPARTDLSDRVSKELHKRGMRFVGSTIIYAYMQAIGVVNDHLVTCFRHASVRDPALSFIKSLERWVLMVLMEINNSSDICWLVRPSNISLRTSSSTV